MSEYDDLYDKVFDKYLGPPSFPDFLDPEVIQKKTEILMDYIMSRRNRSKDLCDNLCDNFARKNFTREVYETPWDDEPTLKHFCSEECEEAYLYGGDFAYFTCDCCGREVCQQNPRNGWMVQYRYEDSTMYCLKCYEEDILENGHSEEKFKNGQIPGMFLNDSDLEDAGFEPVLPFTDYFVRTTNSAQVFANKALELINNGFKVVVNYERMAIGGIEGTVSMWAKK